MTDIKENGESDGNPVFLYCRELSGKLSKLNVELEKKTQEVGLVDGYGMLGTSEIYGLVCGLLQLIKATKVLDIGTFTGASALAWAEALPEDGKVLTLDIDMTNYKKCGVPIISKAPELFKKIEPIEGPGLQTLDDLITNGQAGSFDMAFIDAEKDTLYEYYEKCLVLVRSGGIVMVDDALWFGKVVDPPAFSGRSQHWIDDVNRKISADPRTNSVLLATGRGLHLAFKK